MNLERVLVTGSSGFIGGYLVEELLNRGYEVVGLDNHSKYGPVSRSIDEDDRYQLVEGDAQDPGLVADLLEGCRHFIAGAALVGGVQYIHAHEYEILAVNERITAAACDAAIEAHRQGALEKVTYIGSSMVFDSGSQFPSTEGHQFEIPAPRASYGFQKLAVEYFARAAHSQYGLPFTIIRPFNCVGIGEARVKDEVPVRSGNLSLVMSHVIPDLVHKVVLGQDPLHLLGDGSQTRHFTYAGDLAKGIVTAMEHPAALNEDFNIATDVPTTILELAEIIWHRIKGPDTPFRHVADPGYDFDVHKRMPDVSKARDLLGFEATTTLDQMLDEVIPWIEKAIEDGRL